MNNVSNGDNNDSSPYKKFFEFTDLQNLCCPHFKTKSEICFLIHLFMSCSPEHI